MKTIKLAFIFIVITTTQLIQGQNMVHEAIKKSDLKKIANQLNLEPGSEQSIETTFIIEKDGTLKDIKASSEYPELEKEAIKILNSLPKFIPRKVENKYVEQSISLPIVFYVETLEQESYRIRKENRIKKESKN